MNASKVASHPAIARELGGRRASAGGAAAAFDPAELPRPSHALWAHREAARAQRELACVASGIRMPELRTVETPRLQPDGTLSDWTEL